MGLSWSLGLFEICRRTLSQSKARLPVFERKQFTRQTPRTAFRQNGAAAGESRDRSEPTVGVASMRQKITRDGWAYVVLVLDWYGKKVVGHYSALGYKTPNAFEKEHFENRQVTPNLKA